MGLILSYDSVETYQPHCIIDYTNHYVPKFYAAAFKLTCLKIISEDFTDL